MLNLGDEKDTYMCGKTLSEAWRDEQRGPSLSGVGSKNKKRKLTHIFWT